jgi:adenylosuccinate synthase
MPVFETFPGWDEDISRARSLSDLPANARDYVSAVEDLSDCRISTIGVGPGRDEIIQINDLLHSR